MGKTTLKVGDLWPLKDNINRVKRKAIEWEKLFRTFKLRKEDYPEYTELPRSCGKRTDNSLCKRVGKKV